MEGHCDSNYRTPVSPQGGFLPSFSAGGAGAGWARTDCPAGRHTAQAHATQACPLLLPGNSAFQPWLLLLAPHPSYQPSYPQTLLLQPKNSLGNTSTLISGCRACTSAQQKPRRPHQQPCPLQQPPALGVAGGGGGEGAKLGLKVHLEMMRPYPQLMQRTDSPVHPSNAQAQERGPACRGGWRGVRVTKETLQPGLSFGPNSRQTTPKQPQHLGESQQAGGSHVTKGRGSWLTSYFPTPILCQRVVSQGCSRLQTGGLQLGEGRRKSGNVSFSPAAPKRSGHTKASSCPLYRGL